MHRDINELTGKVIGLAMEVHKELAPGLLESAYSECLLYELRRARLFVEHQKPLPVLYKEIKLDHGYRIDLLVEKTLVLELKNYPVGLLINFHTKLLKDGIKRFAN